MPKQIQIIQYFGELLTNAKYLCREFNKAIATHKLHFTFIILEARCHKITKIGWTWVQQISILHYVVPRPSALLLGKLIAFKMAFLCNNENLLVTTLRYFSKLKYLVELKIKS